jgi:polyhydroxyalkanoate synthesis regulator phasin
MKEVIEKGINLGIGIAETTKEKVENHVDELIKRGQLAKEKRSKAVKEMLETMKKNEKEFEEKSSAVIDESLNKIGLATKKEVDNLAKTVSDIQKKINS